MESCIRPVTITHGVWEFYRQEDTLRLWNTDNVLSGKRAEFRRHLCQAAVVQGLTYAAYLTLLCIYGTSDNGASYVRWAAIAMNPAAMATCYCCWLSVQVWLSTHDSRLVRKSVVLDWLKEFLSTKLRYKAMTVTLMAMPTWGTSLLIILHHPDTAKRVGMMSFVGITWFVIGVSLCCCWSLLTIIIQRQKGSAVGAPGDYLDRARKRVTKDAAFGLILLLNTTLVGAFSSGSTIGLATPALFILVPITVFPMVWTMFNLRLHAKPGRRRRRLDKSASCLSGRRSPRFASKSLARVIPPGHLPPIIGGGKYTTTSCTTAMTGSAKTVVLSDSVGQPQTMVTERLEYSKTVAHIPTTPDNVTVHRTDESGRSPQNPAGLLPPLPRRSSSRAYTLMTSFWKANLVVPVVDQRQVVDEPPPRDLSPEGNTLEAEK